MDIVEVCAEGRCTDIFKVGQDAEGGQHIAEPFAPDHSPATEDTLAGEGAPPDRIGIGAKLCLRLWVALQADGGQRLRRHDDGATPHQLLDLGHDLGAHGGTIGQDEQAIAHTVGQDDGAAGVRSHTCQQGIRAGHVVVIPSAQLLLHPSEQGLTGRRLVVADDADVTHRLALHQHDCVASRPRQEGP